MSKFKVGDKVRRLDGPVWKVGIGPQVGDICTVSFTASSLDWIGLSEYPVETDQSPFDAEFFELVTELPESAPVMLNGKRQIGNFDHEPTQRLTSETGAQKGMRVTRHDLIPPAALREVAAVYGFGELKYPAGEDGPNWLRGMPFSWNERAALDHISQWREGVDFDEEDGVSHLAHAIWHLLAILEFQSRGIGTDDRPFKR